ncbi:ketol-acid reductoisomerase, partial [Buchnera aphidicola (Hormaphis cornu)]
MPNYFKSLNFRNKLKELNKCRLMKKEEFKDGVNVLKSKK